MKSLKTALIDMVNSALKSFVRRMHICTPGVVKSYDSTKNLASVQLTTSVSVSSSKLPPIVNNVVVLFPGTDRFRQVFEIKEGDQVLLHFSDVSIQEWIYFKTIGYPNSKRRFNINDCYAVPCQTTVKPSTLPSGSNAIFDIDGSTLDFKATGSIVLNGVLEVRK